MNIRTICCIALVVTLMATLGCSRRPSSSLTGYTVDQVIADPQSFNHRLVTIRGCYVPSSERFVLQSCEIADQSKLLWLENSKLIKGLFWQRLPEVPSPEPQELRTRNGSFLVFNYDEARNRAAWKMLGPRWPESVLEVTVIGQLETRTPGTPVLTGWGEVRLLEKHPVELFVADVLQARVIKSGSVPMVEWAHSPASRLPNGLDAPIHEQRLDLGPIENGPVTQELRIRMTCFYYPTFMVKQVDQDWNKGTNSMSIVPVTEGIPECSQSHLAGEKELTGADFGLSGEDSKWWIGDFFAGARGDLLFFEYVDGLHGGRSFTVYSIKAGKAIFEDSAVGSGEWWWDRKRKRPTLDKRELIATSDGRILLRYWRVVPTDCDLYRRELCWEDVKKTLELKTPQMPVCRYYEQIRAHGHYASAIVYPVEVSLFPKPVTKVVEGPVTCWPVS